MPGSPKECIESRQLTDVARLDIWIGDCQGSDKSSNEREDPLLDLTHMNAADSVSESSNTEVHLPVIEDLIKTAFWHVENAFICPFSRGVIINHRAA